MGGSASLRAGGIGRRTAGIVVALGLWGAALAIPDLAVAAWNQPVASSLNVDPARTATSPDIASAGSRVYVAWQEPDATGVSQIRVKEFVHGGWKAIGGSLNVNPARGAQHPSIAIVGGVPWVAWSEWNGTYDQVRVARFTAGAWSQPLAAPVSSGSGAINPSIADVGGVAWVTWSQLNGTVDQIRAARFFDGGWDQPVSTPLNFDPTHSAVDPRIANVGGVPYVVWQESVSGGPSEQLRVKSFGNGGWNAVGGSPSVGPVEGMYSPSIAAVGGVPYVAWTEASAGTDEIRVSRFVNGVWNQPLAKPLNVDPTKSGGEPSIADVGGVPYVAWSEWDGTTFQIRASRFAGGAWSQPVAAPLTIEPTQDAAYYPRIDGVGSVPYVTWSEAHGYAPGQVKVVRLQWTLTVADTGAGSGAVTSSPPGIDCGSSCSHSYTNNTQVTLTATSSAGSTFTGWSGGGCSGTGTCQVTMSSDQSVTASFSPTPPSQHTLTVLKSGSGHGSVTSSPAGISCGTSCQYAFPGGAQVTLTATPFLGSTFAGWSGACSGTGACHLTIGSDQTVTAAFNFLAPVISGLGVYPHTFTLSGKLAGGHCVAATRANRAEPGCTRALVLRIAYRLSIPARVKFTFKRQLAGRLLGGRCVSPTRRLGGQRRCKRLVAVRGSLTRTAAANAGSFSFNGVLAGRRLGPGIYQLTATPAANGLIGKGRAVTFEIRR